VLNLPNGIRLVPVLVGLDFACLVVYLYGAQERI
jgi:hypothetical protein